MSGDMNIEVVEAPKPDIPDLDNLEPWLKRNVTEPDISYTADPLHPMDIEDALELTRDQFRQKVRNREQRRASINQTRQGPYLTKPKYENDLVEELMDMAGISKVPTLEHR